MTGQGLDAQQLSSPCPSFHEGKLYKQFGTEEKGIPFCSFSDEESQILGYARAQQLCQLGSDLSLVLGSHKAPLKLSVLYKEVTSAGTILRKQHGGLRPRSDTK